MFTVIVPPVPVVMSRSAAPPVPALAVFTRIFTAFAPVEPVVIVPPAFCVKLSLPAAVVFALIAMSPVLALPSAAPSVIASALDSVSVPPPVTLAPAMFKVPAVLVSAMSPVAPVTLAVKLAPSLSVINIPPVPAAAVMVPAVVRMFAPLLPMPLAAPPVVRATVPEPLFNKVAAVCVIEPPVALP